MSPEFIAIIAVGVSVLGFIFALHLRMERRVDRAEDNTNQRIGRLEESTNQRIGRLEENTNQRIDRLEADVKQCFREVDTRLRAVEQNQAHLAGELSSIRELLRLQPVGLD